MTHEGITPPLLGDPNQFAAPIGPPAAGAAGDLSALEAGGGVLQIAGVVVQAVGAFYAAESQKYQLKSNALTLEFESSIASINARAAEADVAAIFEAGRRRRAAVTLRFGQIKARQRVSTAGRGIQAGVGSAAEVATSIELATTVDAYAIDANTFRAVQAGRRRALDLRNRALLTGVSARNVREAGRGISPGLAAATSLLGGAADTAQSFARRR